MVGTRRPQTSTHPQSRGHPVRVANEFEKATLIDMDPEVFFTEPHYDGYPAILVRLRAIDPDLLRVIVTDGWRCQVPRRLLRERTEGGVRSTD